MNASMLREDKCQLKSCMTEEGEYATINRALALTWTMVVCEVTSPIYRTHSIIVLDLVKKMHRCNAQRAGKRWFLILEFLLF